MPVNTFITANGRIRRRITTDEEKVTEQVAVVTNALGSVVATYKDGWLTADRGYDPYGETRAEWNDVGRFGWVGGLGYRETRREWVSHYVRARHYGSPMGMWTSVDPLWPSEPAFGYVGGRIVKSRDPSGLQVFDVGQPWCFSAQRPCDELLRGKSVPPALLPLTRCLLRAAGRDEILKCLEKHGKRLTKQMWRDFGPYIVCMSASHIVSSGPGPGLDACNPPSGEFGQECCYQNFLNCVIAAWIHKGKTALGLTMAIRECEDRFKECGFATAFPG
jgi:RHS repeat-associated protein